MTFRERPDRPSPSKRPEKDPLPSPLPQQDPDDTRSEDEKGRVADLIALIKESADKLGTDGSSRGDLKLISRALRELRYAFKVFSPYRRRRKVTVFGSARTSSSDPAFTQAIEFGRSMACNDWLVVTGAASGIMEAGHIGAGRENSMGLNIILPFEQGSNPIISGDSKLVYMKYFFTRKLMFVKECDAVVLLPGGFGTMDEGFEVLTLLQTGKRDIVPIVFLDAPGESYWSDWREFIVKQLLKKKLISPEDLSLFKLTDNVDEAVEEVLLFYRHYHSMRYVRDKLVLRLKFQPDELFLETVSRDFQDLLASGGRFDLKSALPDEQEEIELAHFPRLVFKFNRRSLGRLRELINFINQHQHAAA